MFTRCAFSLRFKPIFKSALISFSVFKLDAPSNNNKDQLFKVKAEIQAELVGNSRFASVMELKPKQESKLHFLWSYLRKEWFLLSTIVVITAINSALAVSLPTLISKLMYSINAKNTMRLVTVMLLRSIVMMVNTRLLFSLGERITYNLKMDLFKSIIHRDLGWFDGRFENEILGRLESDSNELKHNMKQFIATGLRSVFEITGTVFTLFYLNMKLSLILLGYLPIIYTGLSIYGAQLRKLSKKCKQIEQESGNISSQSIQNIKIVRSFHGEQLEIDKYQNSLSRSQIWNNSLGLYLSIFHGLVQTSIATMILSVLYFGGNMVLEGVMSGEQLLNYLTTTQASQKSFDNLGFMLGQAVKIHGICDRLSNYIRYKNKIQSQGGIQPRNFQGKVEFIGASFRYPTRPDQFVLKDFTLEIPAGKVLAICGQSGSGKSTLGQLIERFYDLEGGKLLIDGQDIQDLDPTWLRQHVGYITQEPTLFGTSIMENIRYGNVDATDAEVIEAARQANALDFITNFPQGFNTIVGERGSSLSGGQKQRIAIARAILKDPQLLILDEGTSALDTQSEVAVQSALDKLMKGRTVVIIAHRLSTIEKADKIVVMGNPEAGGILEQEEYAEPRSISGVQLSAELLDPGTVICMQLCSRERFKATNALIYSHQTTIPLSTLRIEGEIPSFNRVEELFFKILDYTEPPRDRYKVECVNRIFNGGVFPIEQDKKERTLKVALTPELRTYLLDEVSYDVYAMKREINKVKTKSMAKLEAGKISLEEYNQQYTEAVKKYDEAKLKLEKESDKYVLGDFYDIKLTFSLDCDDFKSQFINVGDVITAKRKNVKLVVDDSIPQPLQIESYPRYVTNWSGRILNPKVREIISVGNKVRIATIGPYGCVYMHVTRDMGDKLEGILMPTYLISNDQQDLIGYYFTFSRSAIIEVPEGWGPVNAAMGPQVKKYYTPVGFSATGATAV